MRWLFITIFVFLISFIHNGHAANWTIEHFEYDAKTLLVGKAKIRSGFLPANPNKPFKGNILYLQGLADSMMNHEPLFQTLSDQGYRVISFDYMGQGGSSGTMNHTRVLSKFHPNLNIKSIAKIVLRKFANPADNRKIILGWSTGALAGYEMAKTKWADAVILIAPGICAKTSVGEGLLNGNRISLRTLTSDFPNYNSNHPNPHIDPIKPESPLHVPLFAKNLLKTSLKSQHWNIPIDVKGLILNSGVNDNYVDSECNERIIHKNASHFSQITYPLALHEIDNEIESIRHKAINDIIIFLNSL